MTKGLRIGLVAGEVSGDALGAGLIEALSRRFPDALFEGIGGPRMIACGMRSLYPMERLSVMGFVEPLGRLPELLRIKKGLEQHFLQTPPDVFVGIDSPGFNLRLERSLRAQGLTTVHYVSPSVWAWGARRIHDIARAVDLMLALFPFETTIYQQHGIAVRCVGHPLADQIDPREDDDQVRLDARAALGLPADARILSLMPGSRRDEVSRLGSIFIATALQCLQQNPQLHFVLPCANAERREQLQSILQSQGASPERFHIMTGESHTAIRAADLVLLASGTATLETLLLRRPMVVCYRLAPLTWMLASRMLKVDYVSLPNLLAGRELVPEYLQDAVTAPILSQRINALLASDSARQQMLAGFARIHQHIRRDASAQAADAIADLLAARAGQGR